MSDERYPRGTFVDGYRPDSDERAENRFQNSADRLPASRICPNCQVLKHNPRQWNMKFQIEKPREERVCRKCENMEERRWIKPVDSRPSFQDMLSAWRQSPANGGSTLRQIRWGMRISLEDFAYHCGWSGPNQSRLETKPPKNPRQQTLQTLKFVIEKLAGGPLDIGESNAPGS